MRELKRWCLSQLQNLEVRLTGEPSGTKLQASSSAAGGVDEDEGAALALAALPHSRGAQQGQEELSQAEAGAANHCLVVHVESLPGNLIHVTRFSTPVLEETSFSGYGCCLARSQTLSFTDIDPR